MQYIPQHFVQLNLTLGGPLLADLKGVVICPEVEKC